SYEMFAAFLGHLLGIKPLYFYQVVGHFCVAFSLPFVFYWCARIFGLNRWTAAIGALLGLAFLFLADQSPYGVLLGAGLPLVPGNSHGVSGCDISFAGSQHYSKAHRHKDVWPKLHALAPRAGLCDWRAC